MQLLFALVNVAAIVYEPPFLHGGINPPVELAKAANERVRQCAELYPPDALSKAEEGSTALDFTIATDGRVKDIVVQVSSGFADLDAAAVACAGKWVYGPIVLDGVPVTSEFRSRATVRFSTMGYFGAPVAVTGNAYSALLSAGLQCLKPAAPSTEQLAKAGSPSRIRVHVLNGQVQSAVSIATSGDVALDQRAAECFGKLDMKLPGDVTGPLDFTFPVYWDQYASW